jgi:hypothetical protein
VFSPSRINRCDSSHLANHAGPRVERAIESMRNVENTQYGFCLAYVGHAEQWDEAGTDG